MLESIYNLEIHGFRFINDTIKNPFFDVVMKFLSGKWPWVIFIGVAVTYCYFSKSKRSLLYCLLALLCITLTDAAASHVLKPYFDRLRPCHALEFVNLIPKKCGGKYGLPSAHAGTAMALAVYLALWSRSWWSTLGFVIAFAIGFSRIYVGVHFPGDVLFGFVLGTIISIAVYCASQLYMQRKGYA